MTISEFLHNAYTAYQAVDIAATALETNGFVRLDERATWQLTRGGKYYVIRGGSSLIAFVYGDGDGCKLVASHTDSPALKLKDKPVIAGDFSRLNVEVYGGALLYSFLDRPLRLAGRIVRQLPEGRLVSENYVSRFTVAIPSLAIHMNRECNDKLALNPQLDMLPLLSLDNADSVVPDDTVSFDLYAVPDSPPFLSGLRGEFLSASRIDNLSSVYASIRALCGKTRGICVAACLDAEEIGSRTRQGADSDFLQSVLARIAQAADPGQDALYKFAASSLCASLDNAHSVHPNHAEKSDPTNRAKLGGGIVIKGHAGGAYTTDAVTSAVMKTLFDRAGVRYQTFYNRSDMRSGSTLGAVSLGHVGIRSVDLGLAQLAMHSAVETIAAADLDELDHGLAALYNSTLLFSDNDVQII